MFVLYKVIMKKFNTILLIMLIIFTFSGFVISATCTPDKKDYTKHLHSESSYQRAWAKKNNAIVEYKNDDYTRVDCLTDTHAVEFDLLANGQNLLDKLYIINTKQIKKPWLF